MNEYQISVSRSGVFQFRTDWKYDLEFTKELALLFATRLGIEYKVVMYKRSCPTTEVDFRSM